MQTSTNRRWMAEMMAHCRPAVSYSLSILPHQAALVTIDTATRPRAVYMVLRYGQYTHFGTVVALTYNQRRQRKDWLGADSLCKRLTE